MSFRRFNSPKNLAVILLGLSSVVFSANGQSSNVVVRVMASNLTGNSQTYGAPQIRIFQGLKPDVVCIQEFNYGGDIRAFVDEAFGTNFNYFRESGYNIPNGIISRWPIINSGSWDDTEIPDRGFAWAQIDLPGTNNLYAVSVHLSSSGGSSTRATEAANLKTLIQDNFPANAWVIVAGDMNSDTRSETVIDTLTSFLSDDPIPTDAESGGDPDTNMNRNKPYDYVLPSFSLTNRLTNVVFTSHSYSKGLVFDSRVYSPLSDVAPVLVNDSTNGQHMGVLKDFFIPVATTNNAPSITAQPQTQTAPLGSNATFTVTADGAPPLSYQWRFSGTNIGGATATSYTRLNAQTNDAGDYAVVVTNSFGSITSSIAVLTVSSAPIITNQPQGLTVTVGQSATFTVGAAGALPLSYQWRFFGTNLPGATTNSFSRVAAQIADAGNYLVVVTNSGGSVTSAVAALTVNVTPPGSVIAQWNFNSTSPDTNTATGTTTPSAGSGTASLVTALSQSFFSGSSVDPANSGTDNSGWSTTSYPGVTNGNKTAGVRFDVSTVGKQNIVVRWDQRVSNTGSKYSRLQYTTNGTDFLDFPTAITVASPTNFEPRTNNLGALPGVNNNASFGFHIVSEFEFTATGSGTNAYVAAAAANTYGTSGTVRFDMVTVFGDALSASNPPPAPATLSAPAATAGQFQFLLTGSAGSNYIVQASTNLSISNWVSLRTNASPFTFTDTSAGNFLQRFYRAIAPQ